MEIVADPNIPFVREAFTALGTVTLVPGRKIDHLAVREADVLLVRSVTPVHSGLLGGSRVKFVGTATIGTDHIDRAYLAGCGIGFASAAGSNANSVAEYVVAALLELARRGKSRLAGKTIGVVGAGNVGSRVARYAAALGLRVLLNDPPRARAEGPAGFVPLERLLAEADIISLHVPLTGKGPDATRHLVHEAVLAEVNRKPVLVNTSRGAVVDNAALLRAIRAGKLSATVLDVWENEPDISRDLLRAVDLGTPHIAGYSFDGKAAGTRMIHEAACNFFGKTPSWTPVLPPALVDRVVINVHEGEDDEDVLRRAIARVYDINADDAALRARPEEFDHQRAEYPVRREFFNTEAVLKGAGDSLRRKFAALGFQVRSG